MPRAVSAETAAKRIVAMVAKGEAKNADDAINQKPELASGRALVMLVAEGMQPAPASTAPVHPSVRPSGSGPARLSR
jgi:hypothetical protein